MKILVVTKNWIGDVIFQSPAIQALRDHFPQAEIVVMAPARCLEVLRTHPAIDRLVEFDERNTHRSFLSKLCFILKLRRESWDRAYFFHRSKSRALLLLLAGVKERIGFGAGRRFFLTRAYEEPPSGLHHADIMLALLRRDGIPVSEHGKCRFYYSEAARDSVLGLLRRHQLQDGKFVCFHLGANWEPKRWPTGCFAALADLIEEHLHYPVVVTGHAADQALCDTFKTEVSKARIISCVGQTTLEELAALFRHSAFLVTGDSGPMHIGAASGARVAALFGPTNPELTGPRGIGETTVLSFVPEGFKTPWYEVSMPAGGWLSNISPQSVLEKIIQNGWGTASLTLQTQQEPVTSKYALTDEERAVKKILWVTLSNLGDVILTTAVLRVLKGRFPQAEVTAVVGPRARGVLEKSRWIRRLVIYDKHAGLLGQWRFLQELRQERYDLVVDLRNTAIPFLVKARKRSPLFRRFHSLSMRARHLEVLTMMGIRSGASPRFDFFLEEDEASLNRKLLEKGIASGTGIVVFAPVAASELKTWKIEGYAAVVQRLLSVTEDTIVIVGNVRERTMSDSLTRLDSKRVINLAGETTWPETTALVAKARLIVANDSSLMHLGYELATPVVAVYGPTNHEKSGHDEDFFKVVRAGSPCSPCDVPQCRFDRQHCFEDLKPEIVARACEELLHVPAASR